MDRFKARLVAKGYNQVEGLDYYDSFSPVAKLVTVKLFLAIAAAKHWMVHQVDINNAFLHGFLDEEVYMLPPQGYDKATDGQVCKLKRSLYGLKQASRECNVEFSQQVHGYGFTQSPHNHCLFIKSSGGTLVILLVYVDDVLIANSLGSEINVVKKFLHGYFTIKDRYGDSQIFLGVEIDCSQDGIILNQRKYALDIIRSAGLATARPANTPFSKLIEVFPCLCTFVT